MYYTFQILVVKCSCFEQFDYIVACWLFEYWGYT